METNKPAKTGAFFGAFSCPAMLLTGLRQLAYSPLVKWQILPVGWRSHSSARPASFPLKDEVLQ